jgi:hemoglobin-like flavoprotein
VNELLSIVEVSAGWQHGFEKMNNVLIRKNKALYNNKE